MDKIEEEDLQKLKAANIRFQESEVELARVSHQEDYIKKKKLASLANYERSLNNLDEVRGDIQSKYNIHENQGVNTDTGEILTFNE